MFDVYIHFFVCAFFSVLSRPLFSSQNFFFLLENWSVKETQTRLNTHTHTRRESEREKSAHATRDSFLFIFLSLYPSADASTKKRFKLKTERALA